MSVFQESRKPEYLEKNLSRCRVENQQTQPTYDAEENLITDPLRRKKKHLNNIELSELLVRETCVETNDEDTQL